MKELDAADQRRLMGIAKRSIETAVVGGRRHERHDRHGQASAETEITAGMAQCAGAFVTLREEGNLRGCIGLLRFDVPLWENVRDAAAAAALDDPRFYSVTPEELPLLELEISVLEPPVPISNPAEFVAGRHGIVIEQGFRHGLLLPQVAPEMGWGEREMLEGVCRKANLPRDAWRDPASRLAVFEAFCFADETGIVPEPSVGK